MSVSNRIVVDDRRTLSSNGKRMRRRKRNQENMCAAPRPFRHKKQEDESSGDPPSRDQDEDEEVESSMVNYAIRLSQLSYPSPEIDYKQKGVIVSNELKPIPLLKPESTYERGESSMASLTCSICKDANPKGMILLNRCRHAYCRGCVPALIGGQINDLPDITKVKCADSECKTTILYEKLGSYVPDEVMERWKAAKAESSVLWLPVFLWCPFEECGEVIVDDERGFRIRACPYCWRVFCVFCKVKWHLGKSCEAFQEELKLERKRQEELEMERKEKEAEASILQLIKVLEQATEEMQKMKQEAEVLDEVRNFNSRRVGFNNKRRSMWDKDWEGELERAQQMEALQQRRQKILELIQEHRRSLLEKKDGDSGDE